jgi:Protein of unknown function (DUF3833)
MSPHTPLSRRALLVGTSASAAGVLLTLPALAHSHGMKAGELILDEWFRGPTWALGRFKNGFDGTERKLAVDLFGRWNGKALSLFEDFFYADGERDQKTWVFTRNGVGTYDGKRSDVVTPAPVSRPAPDRVRFGYTADLKLPSGSTARLSFDDTLVLRPDGTVLNTALVYRYFITVGDIELVFRKGRMPARYRAKGGWS